IFLLILHSPFLPLRIAILDAGEAGVYFNYGLHMVKVLHHKYCTIKHCTSLRHCFGGGKTGVVEPRLSVNNGQPRAVGLELSGVIQLI
ncbi:MAG: hypothetical protein J6Y90_02195, partial [Lachnospiraceae bacterium]|nr:hypothetical protein [Lachnospiraceae bacterium]